MSEPRDGRVLAGPGPRLTGSTARIDTSPDADDRAGEQSFAVLAAPPGPERRLVCDALAEVGIRGAAVASMRELRACSARLRPDIIIVDAVLAADRADILGLVRTARAPLIAIAVHQLALRVELLIAGADDCLPAPFVPEELAARAVAIGRRRAFHDGAPSAPAALLPIGPLRIDVRARRVEVRGVAVTLTDKEFDLLRCFVRHSGETLCRDRLLAEVWGYTVGDTSTVTVHVRRLRSKVEIDASSPELIRTVWGIGYRFSADGDSAGVSEPPRVPAEWGLVRPGP